MTPHLSCLTLSVGSPCKEYSTAGGVNRVVDGRLQAARIASQCREKQSGWSSTPADKRLCPLRDPATKQVLTKQDSFLYLFQDNDTVFSVVFILIYWILSEMFDGLNYTQERWPQCWTQFLRQGSVPLDPTVWSLLQRKEQEPVHAAASHYIQHHTA